MPRHAEPTPEEPTMTRGYQYGFSSTGTAMYDVRGREKKARTMVAVLEDFLGRDRLQSLSLLNVGGSAGIIDNYLADHFAEVIGLDIDAPAVAYAQANFTKANLSFVVGDALNLQYGDQSFDVVISSHVYEHVPDAGRMLAELYRVLKPGGVCYFAAGNRIMWNEPHYNLKLLSVMPRWLAHHYIRAAGKAPFYHEKHYTYWGLRKLVGKFAVHDYTAKVIAEPQRFGTDYMIRPGSWQARCAALVANHLTWLCPGYIWVLQKPPTPATRTPR